MQCVIVGEGCQKYVDLAGIVNDWDKVEKRLAGSMVKSCLFEHMVGDPNSTDDPLTNVIRQFGEPLNLFFLSKIDKVFWVHFSVIPEVSQVFGVDIVSEKIKAIHSEVKSKFSELCGPGLINSEKLFHLAKKIVVLSRVIEKMDFIVETAEARAMMVTPGEPACCNSGLEELRMIDKIFKNEKEITVIEHDATLRFLEIIGERRRAPISTR